ncbi:DUF3099 domain-containing protein [Microbacterium sp.]|uniref:DUF3099 domain-containing protein n=1 Tax=Microbacterium sp. TaxID=51671 RepID=UPI00281214D6|nr:DUF3099 domain-containing protein [Microbacterium sp.]
MKRSRHAPAVTSLPQAPNDEASRRVRRYALTMGIRMVCFLLMFLVQPYGWYTWLFAVGAAVLPYVAVVFANAGSDSTETAVESPSQQIEAPRAAPQKGDDAVITVQETRDPEQPRDDER